ncbi:hypothetical protein BJ508DRAFT_412657 [Ascobolus immersus RN42]|uniref:Uncharacterized protein n=1 Tax=Ascobolus immersus RN42 TaxID=1160509 RepID=A0A3N4IK82_ASCIM|nr:hypothetical protein BJ508DRAFT_412657 [Ascobolus immersus RN42]
MSRFLATHPAGLCFLEVRQPCAAEETIVDTGKPLLAGGRRELWAAGLYEKAMRVPRASRRSTDWLAKGYLHGLFALVLLALKVDFVVLQRRTVGLIHDAAPVNFNQSFSCCDIDDRWKCAFVPVKM